VVLRALKRDPVERFQSMREFAEALEPFGPSERASQSLVRPRGRLGEILVADGLITQDDLERALEVHQQTGVLLGRALLDLGLVAHDDLLAALAKQQGITTPPAAITTERPKAMKPRAVPARAPSPRISTNTKRVLIAVAIALPLGVLGALALGSAVRAPHTAIATQPTR
jgi:hypothetical protein